MSNKNKNRDVAVVETNNEGETTNNNTNSEVQLITTAQEKPIEEVAKKEEIDTKAMLKEMKTKSAVIRALFAKGMKVNEIHKLLKSQGWHSDRNPQEPIRYQHVLNVIKTPLVAKKD